MPYLVENPKSKERVKALLKKPDALIALYINKFDENDKFLGAVYISVKSTRSAKSWSVFDENKNTTRTKSLKKAISMMEGFNTKLAVNWEQWTYYPSLTEVNAYYDNTNA